MLCLKICCTYRMNLKPWLPHVAATIAISRFFSVSLLFQRWNRIFYHQLIRITVHSRRSKRTRRNYEWKRKDDVNGRRSQTHANHMSVRRKSTWRCAMCIDYWYIPELNWKLRTFWLRTCWDSFVKVNDLTDRNYSRKKRIRIWIHQAWIWYQLYKILTWSMCVVTSM